MERDATDKCLPAPISAAATENTPVMNSEMVNYPLGSWRYLL